MEESHDDFDDIDVSFELLNSVDCLTITLVCSTEKELNPYDYAEALRAFADRIETLSSINEQISGTLN